MGGGVLKLSFDIQTYRQTALNRWLDSQIDRQIDIQIDVMNSVNMLVISNLSMFVYLSYHVSC